MTIVNYLRRTLRFLMIAMGTAAFSLAIAGCEDDADDDLEEVGESVQDAAEDAGDAVEDATDDLD